MDVTYLKSALLTVDGATLCSHRSVFEALIRIIEMMGYVNKLHRIINLTEIGLTVEGDVEPRVDPFYLILITRTIVDIEDRNHLKKHRTYSQEELDTILLFSCQKGFTFLVRELVQLGANVQTRDTKGNTPLLICAKKGFTNIARMLINRKVNINAANNAGDTALILATGSYNSAEMVKLLLAQRGIKVNHENKEGNTALMKVVKGHSYAGKSLEVVQLLLAKRGIDVNHQNKEGDTALIKAVEPENPENNSVEIVKILLAKTGIDVNHQNKEGDTALIKAVEPGNPETNSVEMVKLLLAHRGVNLSHQNKEGNTVLMKAVEAKNVDVMTQLLDSLGNKTERLKRIKNCRSETATDIADKLRMGNIVSLLKKRKMEVNNPLVAAVLSCDIDSFNSVMDSHVYEPSDKQEIIQDCFDAIFEKHEKSKENFSENEGMIIQRLLQCGADFDDFVNSSNPLEIATMVGSCSVLTMLLNQQASSHNLFNRQQEYLLATSVEHGHAHIIELLFKRNKNLPVKRATTLALISAMKLEHRDCVEMLKKYGASLDIKFAVESAVEYNDSIRLKYLVEKFTSEINQTFSTEAMNAFMISAARCGHIDIIGVLLDAGTDVNYVSSENKTPLMEAENAEVVNFLVQRGANVNMKVTDDDQVSPLSYVLYKCYYHSDSKVKVKIVEALLKHGADVNEESDAGSPLTIAVLNRADEDIVRLLLDHGADVNDRDNSYFYNTVLLNALTNKASKNVVQLLLDHGAEVNVRNRLGDSVLLIATELNCTENIECLLQHSGVRNEINVKNRHSFTSLMNSARMSNESAVEALINHGADVNVKNSDGNTALMIAASSKIQDPDVLTALIQAGSDVNWQNVRGHSSLTLAAKHSWKDALVLFIDSGADVNAVSGKNETALSLILNEFDHDFSYVEYLLDHGARASYVRANYAFMLILRGQLEIIPKLMRCGFGPAKFTVLDNRFRNIPANTTVTPLYAALVTGNVKLASYFVKNLFVTKYDMFTLIFSKNVRRHLRSLSRHDCLAFLDKLSAQPLSLFSLACLEVQSAVGVTPGREERINVLPLSQIIKDQLMFKAANEHLDFLDS